MWTTSIFDRLIKRIIKQPCHHYYHASKSTARSLAITLLVNSCPNLRWHTLNKSFSLLVTACEFSLLLSEQSFINDFTNMFWLLLLITKSPAPPGLASKFWLLVIIAGSLALPRSALMSLIDTLSAGSRWSCSLSRAMIWFIISALIRLGLARHSLRYSFRILLMSYLQLILCNILLAIATNSALRVSMTITHFSNICPMHSYTTLGKQSIERINCISEFSSNPGFFSSMCSQATWIYFFALVLA